MKKIAIKFGKIAAAIGFWIFVWYLISKAVGIELILPSPYSVFLALVDLVKTSIFWTSTALSFLRVLGGIMISLVIGCGLAYLMSHSKIINTLFSPILAIIKATPVASFIIIAWLWINTSVLPVFISSLIVIPIITANVSEGISSIDKDLYEVASLYRFSPFKKLFKLYIPSIAPFFIAACRSSLGMAWKASVAAELIVISKNSIGREMFYAKQGLETATVFAWTVVVIILSIVFEYFTMIALNKLGNRLSVIRKGETYVED